MPKCPKCGERLKKDAEICTACGFRPKENRGGADAQETSALLVSVWDPIEAEMLRARLESAGIPFYMKPHDDGGPVPVVMGSNGMGGDFYVPGKLLDAAREAAGIAQGGQEDGALSGETPPESGESSDTGERDNAAGEPQEQNGASRLEEASRSLPKRVAWSVLTLVIIGVVLAAYFLFDVLLDYIRKLFGY